MNALINLPFVFRLITGCSDRVIYSVPSPLWESTQCTQYKEDKDFRVSFSESLILFVSPPPLVRFQLSRQPARRTSERCRGSERRRTTPCPRALLVRCNKRSSVFTRLRRFRYFPVSSQRGDSASGLFRFRHPICARLHPRVAIQRDCRRRGGCS